MKVFSSKYCCLCSEKEEIKKEILPLLLLIIACNGNSVLSYEINPPKV